MWQAGHPGLDARPAEAAHGPAFGPGSAVEAARSAGPGSLQRGPAEELHQLVLAPDRLASWHSSLRGPSALDRPKSTKRRQLPEPDYGEVEAEGEAEAEGEQDIRVNRPIQRSAGEQLPNAAFLGVQHFHCRPQAAHSPGR